MIILKYAVFILISIILAGFSMQFRQYYVEEKKVHLLDAVGKQKVLSVLICSVYVLFAVLGLIFQERKELSLNALSQCILLWDGLFLIALIDLKLKKIPNKLLLILLLLRVLGIAADAIMHPDDFVGSLVSSLIGMAVGASIILIVLLISKGEVGAGDLKLFAVIGFYFGLQGLIQIMIYTLFFSAIVAIVLLVSRKAKMKSTMPMAPFVFLGLTIFYLFL